MALSATYPHVEKTGQNPSHFKEAGLLLIYAHLRSRRFAIFRGHFSPAGGREAGELLEPASEVALVGESADFGDFGQLCLAAEEEPLGVEDLAFKLEMLGGDAEQFREATVEMEGAQVNVLGDFAKGWAAAVVFGHEEHGGDKASQFGIGGKIGGADGDPFAEGGHHAIENDRPVAEPGIGAIGNDAEDPVLAAGIRKGDSVGGHRLSGQASDAVADIVVDLIDDALIEIGEAIGDDRLAVGVEHKKARPGGLRPGGD